MKRVLDEMIAVEKVVLDQITLIGFSLGAHICGYVGSLFEGSLPRILGSFKKASCSHRLAPIILVDILKRSLSKSRIISSNVTSSSNDVCEFQTFECPNADQWKAGRCFQKCATVDHCPEPGLDFFFSTNNPPKILTRGIYFNTLAYKNDEDSVEFCGGSEFDVDVGN
uniref:Lipase domain-containing protein n=1 Tax=Romanomermis culicivorax TaxID=13658 RepID=A0A915L794_ROMCU